jgi:hypothetical protein
MVLVLIIICMPLKRYKIYLHFRRILHDLCQAGAELWAGRPRCKGRHTGARVRAHAGERGRMRAQVGGGKVREELSNGPDPLHGMA